MTINLPDEVARILDSLICAGYDSYVVGGCVRDALLGQTPHDWDICTAATPNEVKRVFTGYRILDTGLQHGTVTVLVNDKQYEITTFRTDGTYLDNRRPECVNFVKDIVADLSRRDFTINAMAYNPNAGLVDVFEGQKDLKDLIIRSVGNADERFNEDGLRIMRAIRFASVLGFLVEEKTSDSIHRNKALLNNIASERISVELNKILMSNSTKRVLSDYADIIAQIIPEIEPCIGFEQRNPYHYLQVWEHTVEAVFQSPRVLTIRLAMLLHDIGKPASFFIGDDGIGHFYGHPEVSAKMAYQVLRRLKFDNNTIDAVVCLVEHHDAKIAPVARSVRRWLNKLGAERFEQLLEVQRADAMAQTRPESKLSNIYAVHNKYQEVIEQQQCFSLKNLAINGYDVIAMGITDGREIGNVLRFAMDAVIDERVGNDKHAILNLVKSELQK